MSSVTTIKFSFSTWNILNPPHAVKWKEKEGLNDAGSKMSQKDLRASLKNINPFYWKDFSNWDDRCSKVVNIIGQRSDIFCLQEVSEESLNSLQSLMKGHRFTELALHSHKNPVQRFGNVLLYNTDKISLMGNYETRYRAQGEYRSAANALFKISGIPFLATSVHLAGYNPKEVNLNSKQRAKENGFKELEYYEKQLCDFANLVDGVAGIALAGDFNEDLSEAKRDLFRVGYLEKKGYLFNGNGGAATEPSNARRIDFHCWKPLRKQEATFTSIRLEEIKERASDHLPTGIMIEATF